MTQYLSFYRSTSVFPSLLGWRTWQGHLCSQDRLKVVKCSSLLLHSVKCQKVTKHLQERWVRWQWMPFCLKENCGMSSFPIDTLSQYNNIVFIFCRTWHDWLRPLLWIQKAPYNPPPFPCRNNQDHGERAFLSSRHISLTACIFHNCFFHCGRRCSIALSQHTALGDTMLRMEPKGHFASAERGGQTLRWAGTPRDWLPNQLPNLEGVRGVKLMVYDSCASCLTQGAHITLLFKRDVPLTFPERNQHRSPYNRKYNELWAFQ